MTAHLIRGCYVNTRLLRLYWKGERGNHKHAPEDYLGQLFLFIFTLRWADKINLVCMFGRKAEETVHCFTQRGRLRGKGRNLEEDLSTSWRWEQPDQGNRVWEGYYLGKLHWKQSRRFRLTQDGGVKICFPFIKEKCQTTRLSGCLYFCTKCRWVLNIYV